jgi:lipid-binding SYLF domain-containing protein
MLAVISRRAGVVILCLSLVFTGCSSMPGMQDVQASVREAETTLTAVQNDSELKSFRDSMKNAKAVFIVTPRRARGVVLARDEGTQTWNGPAFYTVTRVEAAGGRVGTLGFSAGEQDLELVALAMTGKAVNWFLSPTLPGKGELNIVAGTGGSASGADMVVFDRSKGAGRAGKLEGTIVSIDHAANQAYYGSPVTPADILVRHSVSNPDAASLRKAVAGAAH